MQHLLRNQPKPASSRFWLAHDHNALDPAHGLGREVDPTTIYYLGTDVADWLKNNTYYATLTIYKVRPEGIKDVVDLKITTNERGERYVGGRVPSGMPWCCVPECPSDAHHPQITVHMRKKHNIYSYNPMDSSTSKTREDAEGKHKTMELYKKIWENMPDNKRPGLVRLAGWVGNDALMKRLMIRAPGVDNPSSFAGSLLSQNVPLRHHTDTSPYESSLTRPKPGPLNNTKFVVMRFACDKHPRYVKQEHEQWLHNAYRIMTNREMEEGGAVELPSAASTEELFNVKKRKISDTDGGDRDRGPARRPRGPPERS